MSKALIDEVASSPSDGARPPFLRRVRIRGYKSIAFCDVALQPLTILVGRNSSGKSNFLDALAFLTDVLAKGTDEAVQLHGGRKAILPRSGRSSVVSFELEIETTYKDGIQSRILVALYDATIKLSAKARPIVASERVRIKNVREEAKAIFARKGERVEREGVGENETAWCPADRLLLGIHGGYPFFEINLGLLASGFYNFSPELIRKLHEPTPGLLLQRDGRNLASVIKAARAADEAMIGRVQGYLSTIVEEVEGFEVVRYGEYETIRFLIRSGVSGKTRPFDAANMSDGTLRALASLVAAFNVPLLEGPCVVGIEEPETALHPAAMRALVDALEEATGRNQILLTTHSAELLNDRDIHPSQILVVRNRDGNTQITPVDAASREIIEKELYSMADLQRQDMLDLDEADLRRQAALQLASGGT